ncbi:MAG TPA: ATP-binding protein [Ktedonobacteraceae bacterium]|nr:ATP-binding protein [Ktedonobacteraceae bacterium]
MKVTFRNLGVISEAEIDLKQLTVFVGPNNSGKTWLAYALAGIFGSYGFTQYIKAYTEEEGVSRTYPLLDDAVERVLTGGTATIDLVQFAEKYGETYFNNIARFARSWMPQFMSTREASFEHLAVSVHLAETKKVLLDRILSYFLRSEISGSPQRPSLSIRKKRGERNLYVYTSSEYTSEEQIAMQLPPDVIREYLVHSALEALHRALYPFVYVLPMERTTFITFPFGGVVVSGEPVLMKELSSQERNRKAVIKPVGNFLSMISSVFKNELEGKTQREREAKNNPKIKEYIQLAELLEKQILSGDVKFSQPESESMSHTQLDPARELLFQAEEDSRLEISIASSMVKELSPLVLYLRYLARPGELLVIDEPEMNLHPEAQAKITEFLAMLVNAGLNILVTTHSPYLVDHLTNLIKAADVEDKESIRNEFYLKRTDAFVSKEKVSVYLFDQGRATKAMGEDGVIDLNTFGEVSDRLSEIYFKL